MKFDSFDPEQTSWRGIISKDLKFSWLVLKTSPQLQLNGQPSSLDTSIGQRSFDA